MNCGLLYITELQSIYKWITILLESIYNDLQCENSEVLELTELQSIDK